MYVFRHRDIEELECEGYDHCGTRKYKRVVRECWLWDEGAKGL